MNLFSKSIIFKEVKIDIIFLCWLRLQLWAIKVKSSNFCTSSCLKLRTHCEGGPNDYGEIFEDSSDCNLIQICENGECKDLIDTHEDAFIFIRIAKPKKSCPNIIIRKQNF